MEFDRDCLQGGTSITMKSGTTLGKHLGQMFILFDPMVQFWGLHNMKIVVAKKSFLSQSDLVSKSQLTIY